MNDGFKQRLVGAVVLVCLALIMWPLIFSDADRIAMDRTSQIPPTPAFEKYTVTAPARPPSIEPVVTPQEQPVAAPTPSLPKAEEPPIKLTPRLDSRNLPEAWVLQIASFSETANARELTKALVEKGYKAYTRTVTTSDGPSTRVYIGPRLTSDAFDDIMPTINKAYGVKAMVVRYEQ
ncbi:SPOR domain-containing protein [Oceanicoccus sp. KOV_DT_Chl]|uniref:SPOR domain-containing protein n=1 Tax=Oceanicoccus sp. KOV_DT_Chl TaxID=1904639 RepID=UPI000C7D7BFA|nr:SPOR domain-containing protein [Oceanicoccus sp. KOV_DT_Chl]